MKNIFVHDSAVVDEGAIIGDYSSIWHYSHVERRAWIGENCNLGQNTYVGNDARIGNGCRLGNSVSVFSHVELEDFVFCAPFMVFTHISYPRAAISRRQVFEKTLVRVGATLGANCTVVPGVTVGMGAFVGAGAVLTTSCKDWSLLVGLPAKQVGWVSAFGDPIPLPLVGDGDWECAHTGDRYRLRGGEMFREAGGVDILHYKPGAKLARTSVSRDRTAAVQH